MVEKKRAKLYTRPVVSCVTLILLDCAVSVPVIYVKKGVNDTQVQTVSGNREFEQIVVCANDTLSLLDDYKDDNQRNNSTNPTNY